MGKINRRELLKMGGLAAASAALPGTKSLGASRKSKQAPSSNRLNVVIHGMSAMVIDRANNRISLMLPDAPGHSYGMGKFGSEFLLEEHDYTLSVPGTENANFPDPDPDLNVVIDLGYSIKPLREKARHVIDLPFPNYSGGDTSSLLRLRVVKRGAQGRFLGEGSQPNPSELPLLYAFSYSFDPSNAPTLSGGGWKIADSTNLHIWSCPVFASDARHAHRAMRSFQEMFDKPLTLSMSSSRGVYAAPRPSDWGGVPAIEQCGILEQRQSLTKDDHLSDCQGIIVTHPHP